MTELSQTWEELGTFGGHTSWIYGVPIAPDSSRAISGSGSDVILWDLETEEVETVLEGHTDTIFSLCISPNGKTVASGSNDKTVKLWNLEDLELATTLVKRKDPIHTVAFDPTSRLLAAGGENKYTSTEGKRTVIYLWDTYTEELIKTFSGHNLRINSVAFSPDGKKLASGSNDATVRVWDISSESQIYLLEGHEDQVSTVAFTPDGGRLISGGHGGFRVWDIKTGNLNAAFSDQDMYVRCFAIYPSGQLLAASSDSGIDIWDFEKGERLHTIASEWPVSIAFSPDGQLLSSGDASAFAEGSEETGGAMRIWRVPLIDSSQTNSIPPVIHQQLEQEGYFEPETIEDARERVMTSIVRRQGQSDFRRQLLSAYNGECAITDCDAREALEAAHIVPYQGVETNHVTNGLLLRADIHTLFDLYLISISPETYTIGISSELLKTSYEKLNGQQMNLPAEEAAYPSKSALRIHYDEFLKRS